MPKLVPISLSPAPFSQAKPAGNREIVDISTAIPPIVPKDREKDQSARLRELEARLSVLESALIDHATILRDRIAVRLDRLEQRFQYEAEGLRRALKTEVSDRRTNIIQLTQSMTAAVDRVESKQMPATPNVNATIEELTAVIADARLHLAGLAHAVRGRESTDGLAS
jgi:hypothetical protein